MRIQISRGIRFAVLSVVTIAPTAGDATQLRYANQRLTWADQALPTGSAFGGSVGLSAEGGSAFVGAPQGGGWASYLFEGATWVRTDDDIWSGVDPSFATCSNSFGADLSVLAASRHQNGTYRVQPMTPNPAPVWVSSIANGHVRAIANAGTVLAVGQPEYAGDNGRILIYERDSFNWVLSKVIFGAIDERLGTSLAFVDSQRLVAGGPGFGDNGAIRIYVDVGDWVEFQVIESPACCQTDAGFGTTVAAAGPWIAIGSPGWNRLLAGGGQDEDVGNVNLYRLDGLLWEHHSALRPSEASAGDEYGTSVALRAVGESGGVLLVGAPDDVVDIVGQGTAFVWWLHGDQWQARWRLAAAGAGAQERLGTSVALGPHGALVGAPGGDANAVEAQGEAFFYLGVVPLFYDGFESGDTTGWSAAVP